MLEIKNIKKSYKTGDFIQHALNGVSLKFRKNEFVAILGPSGSGKTTLLNVIGGLDRYDSGDLIINDHSTKKYKSVQWDYYRNNCIGFIFQSYNLINHINILSNVEMSMTLSGYSKKKRKKLAKEALSKVGLLEHAYKNPNQLSGGQMQRVAIARALSNNPNIILADEPTGALDSKTSEQIMKLIKKISEDKLVIMVTHNRKIAEEYADRIIEIQDGKIINDSKPYEEKETKKEKLNIKKTAMNYVSALGLSFHNIRTKKWRTFITSFAASIGIIGIALILSLSNGFKNKIDEFEKDSLSQMPITVTEQSMQLDEKQFTNKTDRNLKEYPNDKKAFTKKDSFENMVHINKLTKDYIDYIDKINKKYIGSITYLRTTAINLVTKVDNNNYKLIQTTEDIKNNYYYALSELPEINANKNDMISTNFDVIYGNINDNEPGLVLILDSKNQISDSILKNLGFANKDLSFEELTKKEFKLIHNDDYYKKNNYIYTINKDYKKLYNTEKSKTIKIQAILRGKEDKKVLTESSGGIYYTKEFMNYVIDSNNNSKIVKEQKQKNYNVLTTEKFENNDEKSKILGYLGAEVEPIGIYIYPNSFESKEKIVEYLDKYNKNKDNKDKIIYTDMANLMSSLTSNIMDAITIVLIAFSSVSLIVSSIMIGIITYTSVLERTKEIGILRALGARKKDISRVFNAEVLIIGLFSGILGIVVAILFTIPINHILFSLTGLKGIAKLKLSHAITLIVISSITTLIGGFIPAKIASKKDPVIALRSM